MIETLDECHTLKFEHGPCIKLFPPKTACCAVYHSLSNNLIYIEGRGLRCLDIQSFLQLVERQEEVVSSEIPKEVLGDYLSLPASHSPTALRLSPTESVLAIATETSVVFIVQVGLTGTLHEEAKLVLSNHEDQTVMDVQWTLSGELLCCLSDGSLMSLFPHGEWGSPTIKNYTVPAMPRRIGVVGASPMVEDETGALVNAALIATENPTTLLIGHPSNFDDGEFHSLDITKLEEDLVNLFGSEISFDRFSVKGVKSLSGDGRQWVIGLVGDSTDPLSLDVIVGVIELDSSFSRIESVTGLALNELQWNALTDSSDSLSILHLSCLSTFIVGSPQAPDLAVFCSYPGIVGDEGLRSVRSPELNQLCCNQLDCDSAVGCAALLFIPRYRGTIEKSQDPLSALIDPSIILIVQTDGRLSCHYVDCSVYPQFPPIRLAPPHSSHFRLFSIPNSSPSSESSELLSSRSSESSLTSDGFVAVHSPCRGREKSPKSEEFVQPAECPPTRRDEDISLYEKPSIDLPVVEPKSTQTIPIERPFLSQTNLSSEAVISRILGVDKAIQSGDSVILEREWNERAFIELQAWTEEQRTSCRQIIEIIKNGVSVKPAPFNKIGTSLVDGLVAFESTVKELEELCLAAVPPELRDVPPVKEGGVISDSWRRCLSPGLNRLQEEAENTKKSFEEFSTSDWPALLDVFAGLPVGFQRLEENRMVIQHLVKEILRLTSEELAEPPSWQYTFSTYRGKLDDSLDKLLAMGQMTHNLGNLTETLSSELSEMHQKVDKTVERCVDQICKVLSTLEDTESICNLMGIASSLEKAGSILNDQKSETCSLPKLDVPKPNVPRSHASSSNRPRYALNYDDLDDPQTKLTDILPSERPRRISPDLCDEEGGTIRPAEKSDEAVGSPNMVDPSTFDRLESFHEKIKQLRILTKDIRTKCRKSGNALSNRPSWNSRSLYPSLSQSLQYATPVQSPTASKSQSGSTASLRQVLQYLQTPDLSLPDKSEARRNVEQLEPYFETAEAEAHLLRRHNSKLLLRFVQRTIISSRRSQAMIERSAESELSGKLGPPLSKRRLQLLEFSAARRQNRRSEREAERFEPIVLGCLELSREIKKELKSESQLLTVKRPVVSPTAEPKIPKQSDVISPKQPDAISSVEINKSIPSIQIRPKVPALPPLAEPSRLLQKRGSNDHDQGSESSRKKNVVAVEGSPVSTFCTSAEEKIMETLSLNTKDALISPKRDTAASSSLFGPSTRSIFGDPKPFGEPKPFGSVEEKKKPETPVFSKSSPFVTTPVLSAAPGILPKSPFGSTTTSFGSSPQPSSLFKSEEVKKKPSTLGSAGFVTGSSLFGAPADSIFSASVFERKQYSFGDGAFGTSAPPPANPQPNASDWGTGFASFATTSTLSMAGRAQQIASEPSASLFPQSSNSTFGTAQTASTPSGPFGDVSSGFGTAFGSNFGTAGFGTPSTGFGQSNIPTNSLFSGPKSGGGQFRVPDKMD